MPFKNFKVKTSQNTIKDKNNKLKMPQMAIHNKQIDNTSNAPL